MSGGDFPISTRTFSIFIIVMMITLLSEGGVKTGEDRSRIVGKLFIGTNLSGEKCLERGDSEGKMEEKRKGMYFWL